jgi:hypothetical protein
MKKDYIYSFQNELFIPFELEKIAKYFNTNQLNLELCFKYYYREKLNSEFFCSKCNRVHKGYQNDKIYRPPKVLVIVLDRGRDKTYRDKVEINKYLDLSNIIDEKNYQYSTLYRLIGVSTHNGSSSPSGHYTACCLTDNNKYYKFNDTLAYEISEDHLFDDEPYLLFYEQIDINEQDKDEVEKIKKEIKIIQIDEKPNKNNYIISNRNKYNLSYSNKRNQERSRDKEEEMEKEKKREKEKGKGKEVYRKHRVRYKVNEIQNNNNMNNKNEIRNNRLTNITTFNGEITTKKKEDVNKGKDMSRNVYKKRDIDLIENTFKQF